MKIIDIDVKCIFLLYVKYSVLLLSNVVIAFRPLFYI